MKFKGKAVLLLVPNFLLTYLPFIDHIRVGPSFVDSDDCKSYVFLRECLLTSSVSSSVDVSELEAQEVHPLEIPGSSNKKKAYCVFYGRLTGVFLSWCVLSSD
jgi:hypothetical protein